MKFIEKQVQNHGNAFKSAQVNVEVIRDFRCFDGRPGCFRFHIRESDLQFASEKASICFPFLVED